MTTFDQEHDRGWVEDQHGPEGRQIPNFPSQAERAGDLLKFERTVGCCDEDYGRDMRTSDQKAADVLGAARVLIETMIARDGGDAPLASAPEARALLFLVSAARQHLEDAEASFGGAAA